MEDPYKILGVNKKSSLKEIKDAYKKLALEKHPDKPGGSKDEFQKISEAYETLSDPQKKEDIDNPRYPFHNNFMNFNFSDHGGGGVPVNFFFNRGETKSSVPTRGPDKKHEISLSLEDMYTGKTSKFAITRNAKCTKCEGEGGYGKFEKRCIACGGRGFRNIHSGRGVRTVQCMQCDANGTATSFNKICQHCKMGIIKEREIVDAVFPCGISAGFKIVKKGLGDYKKGIEAGDIIIVAKQKPHAFYTRTGKNLKCIVELTFCESIIGFKKKIKHLDDREVEIKCDDIIMNNQKIRIENEGMLKNNSYMEVEFKIQNPGKLSEDGVKKIKNILESEFKNK